MTTDASSAEQAVDATGRAIAPAERLQLGRRTGLLLRRGLADAASMAASLRPWVLVQTLPGNAPITAMGLTACERWLVTGDADGCIRVRANEPGYPELLAMTGEGLVRAIAVSRTAPRAAVARGTDLVHLDLASPPGIAGEPRLTRRQRRILAMAFPADGEHLLFSEDGGGVCQLPWSGGEEARTVVSSGLANVVAMCCPLGQVDALIAADGLGRVMSHPLLPGVEAHTLTQVGWPFLHLKSHDNVLLGVSGDGSATLWEWTGGTHLTLAFLPGDATCATMVNPTLIATGSVRGEVTLWGLDGTQHARWQAHDSRVSCTGTSGSGLWTGGQDGRVRLWQAQQPRAA